MAQHFDAIHFWHVEVKDDDVWSGAVDRDAIERSGAALVALDLRIAQLCEGKTSDLQKVSIVVDHHDARA